MHIPDRPLGKSLDVSVVIPCHNEQECLRNTVIDLVSEFHCNQIVVEFVTVDNGSSDDTGTIIDALIDDAFPVIKVVVNENLGYSYGILEGMKHCNADVLGYTHADGQISPKDVVDTYKLIRGAENRVLAKASRQFRLESWRRQQVSKVYNRLMRILFGHLGSDDINATPKYFSRAVFDQMQCRSEDWFLDPEILIKAKYLGVEVREHKVEARLRQGGQSDVGISTILEFLENISRYRAGFHLRAWRKSLTVRDRRSDPELNVAPGVHEERD